MSLLHHLAAGGVWTALPLTGYLIRRLSWRHPLASSYPAITSFCVASVLGIAVWSLPLLLLAEAGLYSGSVLGLIGWSVTLFTTILLWRKRFFDSKSSIQFSVWDAVLATGLCTAAVLYLGWPTEAMVYRDEGLYTKQAIYLANHGDLHPPYPWPRDAANIFRGIRRPTGAFMVGDTYTFYFGHLYQSWLAQAYSTLGLAGLIRLNALFGLLSAGVFYGLCRSIVSKPLAVTATLFLALNVSQLWLARITLSEMITQLFISVGLLLLTRALRDGSMADAAWAGIVLGLSATVRIDSFVLVPLLLGAHLAVRIVEKPDRRSTRVWLALYATAAPVFALDVLYYWLLSRPYFERHISLIQPIAVASLVAVCLLLIGLTRVSDLIRPVVRNKASMVLVGLVLLVATSYAYFVRPITTTAYFGPETVLEGARSYAENSLVNQAIYLSPAVILAGVLGWYITLWLTVLHRRGLHLLPSLIVVLGVSMLYLYDPVITPLHFWAIRRFLPVTIPGFVFFATVAVYWLLGRLQPSRVRLWIGVLGAMYLLIWTVRGNALIYNFAEHKGQHAQLERLANKLPEDEVILTLHRRAALQQSSTTLYFAFNRRTVSVDARRRNIAVRILRGWVHRQSTATGEPVIVLADWDLPPSLFRAADLSVEPVDTVILSRLYSEWTPYPLPKRIVQERLVVRIFLVRPVTPGAS